MCRRRKQHMAVVGKRRDIVFDGRCGHPQHQDTDDRPQRNAFRIGLLVLRPNLTGEVAVGATEGQILVYRWAQAHAPQLIGERQSLPVDPEHVARAVVVTHAQRQGSCPDHSISVDRQSHCQRAWIRNLR